MVAQRQHMLTGKVAKQFTSEVKEELLLICWYELATDETSDMKMINFSPFLVRYVDKDSGH